LTNTFDYFSHLYYTLAMKIICFFCLLANVLHAGPIMDLVNNKGNSLNAEVISLTKDQVVVKRVTDKKIFKIKVSTLDIDTRKLLADKADEIIPPHPEYEIDIVLGKRGKKASYYMVKQTISTKITVKNKSREFDSPGVKGHVLIFGENQKDDDLIKILSNQSFEVSPATLSEEARLMKEFHTEYDSDNKGYGNVGGYKYSDYIIILTDLDGKLLKTKTINTKFEKLLVGNQALATKLINSKAGTSTNDELSLP